MSQDKNSSNPLSPERKASNKNVNLNSLSPFQLLSMLSRFPSEEPEFKETLTKEPQPKPTTDEPFSFQPVHRNYDAEFKAKYNSIPVIKFTRDETKAAPARRFWERKRRHTEVEDFRSFVAASDTNYTRLDYVPKDKKIDNDNDDDDDAKTWRTQDMLDEEEYKNVVLDTQKIVELKKKIDEDFVKETLISHHQALQDQMPEEIEPVQIKSLELKNLLLHESKRLLEKPLLYDERVEDKGKRLRMEHLLPESQELKMAQASDHDNLGIGAMREKMDYFNKQMDWDDNDGQDFSDNEGLNDTSANQVSTELEFAMEEEKVQFTRYLRNPSAIKIFKNKLAYDVKCLISKKTMEKISDRYFNQLIEQMKEFKIQGGGSDQFSFTDDDMISLMKRQGFLTDKNTVEQLAHKHLPSELTDELCVAAQSQNGLYPTWAQENDAYYY